jgi:hypothetical protein
MNSPSYSIVTICPRMSEKLNSYLNAPVKGAEHMCVKDAIALEITSHYSECHLPFAGTVLAWGRSDAIDSEGLREWLNCLQDLKIWGSDEVVSLEAFVQTIDGGSIAVGGFYPIAAVPPEQADAAYRQASLVINAERQKELTNSAYRRILAGALQTDQLGMIIAVLAEEAEVAQFMIKQAVSLVVPSGTAGENQ